MAKSNYIFFIVFFMLFNSLIVNAQWSDDPGVSNWLFYGLISPRATTDNTGNIFVVGQSAGGNWATLWIQNLSADGYILWDSSGVLFAEGLWGQKGKVLVNDSLAAGLIDVVEGLNGSFLMLYLLSYHTNNNSLYLQRFDNNGNPLWGSRGTLVTSDTSTNFHELISDGNNGAFIS